MRRTPLPRPLADGPFTTAAAKLHGVSRKRTRAADLEAPFHGVRAHGKPADVQSLAAAYAQRMAPGHVFAGITAARLWGLPVRARWEPGELLVIGVPAGATRTRARGTRVRVFDPDLLVPGSRGGLPTLGPASAVLSMAHETSADDLVALIDALVTPSTRYRDLLLPQRPFTTIEALRGHAVECRRMRGAAAFTAALERARSGVDSPQETRCRLGIVAAGLPEPVVQFEVRVAGELVAVIDLAYPDLLIAIEYEGEHHLTDPAQWAKDIRRQELLESLGWIVIRVTRADLRNDAAELMARVRRAIARRQSGA
jgi:hypothetical protein